MSNFSRTPVKFVTSNMQSEPVQCLGVAAKLQIPVGFTTATLSFIELMPDGTYSNDIKDFDGTPISIANVTANDSIPLEPAIFESIEQFKIVSSVAQTGTNPIVVVFTPIFGINSSLD